MVVHFDIVRLIKLAKRVDCLVAGVFLVYGCWIDCLGLCY